MTITIKNSSRSHPVVLINTNDEIACRGIAVHGGWQRPFGPFAQPQYPALTEQGKKSPAMAQTRAGEGREAEGPAPERADPR